MCPVIVSCFFASSHGPSYICINPFLPRSVATLVHQEDSGVESGSEGEMEPGSTVFVKNLNFLTQEADLKEVSGGFEKARMTCHNHHS